MMVAVVDDSGLAGQRNPAGSDSHRCVRTVHTCMKATRPMSISEQTLANAIRALSMDAVQAANSGHPGMPMGMADVATVLFREFLKFDASVPSWADRDRFVLSAGHGSMLIYSLLHLPAMLAPPSRTFVTSASCIRLVPGTRRISSCRASSAPPARWGRGWRWRSVWRWPSGI